MAEVLHWTKQFPQYAGEYLYYCDDYPECGLGGILTRRVGSADVANHHGSALQPDATISTDDGRLLDVYFDNNSEGHFDADGALRAIYWAMANMPPAARH